MKKLLKRRDIFAFSKKLCVFLLMYTCIIYTYIYIYICHININIYIYILYLCLYVLCYTFMYIYLYINSKQFNESQSKWWKYRLAIYKYISGFLYWFKFSRVKMILKKATVMKCQISFYVCKMCKICKPEISFLSLTISKNWKYSSSAKLPFSLSNLLSHLKHGFQICR